MAARAAGGSDPIKVAIIGGGCAAIAAAFELSRPEHRGQYQLTVYQLGWRLGGKGASGRGPANRIEEHGLHLWMGFYENAFRLMRECYAELSRDPAQCRLADWRDAFVAEPFIGVAGARPSDASAWLAHFPPGDGLPGDPLSGYNPFGVISYMVRTTVLLRTLLTSLPSVRTAQERNKKAAGNEAPVDGAPSADDLQATLRRYLKYGLLTTLTGLVSAIRLVELIFQTGSIRLAGGVPQLLAAIAENLNRQFAVMAERDDEVRPVWQILDLLLAFQRGVLRFDLLRDPRGFDALNDYDTREWLRLNGASASAVDCDMMRGLYDLAMAYEDGDPGRPRMAAGLGLRACLRMFFTYRGALMWKMQAGMGDVVFAPFYEVLKRRGVRFEFFHRLRNVQLNDAKVDDTPHVAGLDFDVQAAIKDGKEYTPLINVGGLPCWPATPCYDRLVDGDRCRAEGWDFESHWETRRTQRKTLRVGADFDLVVLGVGLGAIPHICKEIVARDARWRMMISRVKTIASQAFQIWLHEDLAALGWTALPTTMSGFGKPFDTWADMRQLLPEEHWPTPPRAILYFCGAMRELGASADRKRADYGRRCDDEVRRQAVHWLKTQAAKILPKAITPDGAFRWDLLVDPAGDGSSAVATAEARFHSQFWTANVNPSDRYVLSLPKSTRYRISPLDYTYDNLTVAGDWTSCGLNLGCVESAFISGRLAAHAVAGAPALEAIVGYDHP